MKAAAVARPVKSIRSGSAARPAAPPKPLPEAHKAMLERWLALETSLTLMSRRGELTVFQRLKTPVQDAAKRTLRPEHLGQMLALWPGCYKVTRHLCIETSEAAAWAVAADDDDLEPGSDGAAKRKKMTFDWLIEFGHTSAEDEASAAPGADEGSNRGSAIDIDTSRSSPGSTSPSSSSNNNNNNLSSSSSGLSSSSSGVSSSKMRRRRALFEAQIRFRRRRISEILRAHAATAASKAAVMNATSISSSSSSSSLSSSSSSSSSSNSLEHLDQRTLSSSESALVRLGLGLASEKLDVTPAALPCLSFDQEAVDQIVAATSSEEEPASKRVKFSVAPAESSLSPSSAASSASLSSSSASSSSSSSSLSAVALSIDIPAVSSSSPSSAVTTPVEASTSASGHNGVGAAAAPKKKKTKIQLLRERVAAREAADRAAAEASGGDDGRRQRLLRDKLPKFGDCLHAYLLQRGVGSVGKRELVRDIGRRLPGGGAQPAEVRDLLEMLLEAAPKWVRKVEVKQLGTALGRGRNSAASLASAASSSSSSSSSANQLEEVAEIIQFNGSLKYSHVRAKIQAFARRAE
jgi:hypothetical protein